jgi:hypothetical protein
MSRQIGTDADAIPGSRRVSTERGRLLKPDDRCEAPEDALSAGSPASRIASARGAE